MKQRESWSFHTVAGSGDIISRTAELVRGGIEVVNVLSAAEWYWLLFLFDIHPQRCCGPRPLSFEQCSI